MSAAKRVLSVGGVLGLAFWVFWPRETPALPAAPTRALSPAAGVGASPALLSMAALTAPSPTSPDRSASVSAALTASTPGPASAHDPARSFADWAQAWLAQRPQATSEVALARARALALERRQWLAGLIRSDPERALAEAAPYRWYHGLPPAIAALLEEAVSGRGDLEVYCALGEAEPAGGGAAPPVGGPSGDADFIPPGPEAGRRGMVRYARIGGRTYEAFVYGRRTRQPSQGGVALYGIALDRALALGDSPVRALEVEEVAAARAAGRLAATGVCAVTGRTLADATSAVVVDYGGQLLAVADAVSLGRLRERLAAAETAMAAERAAAARAPGGGAPWSHGLKRLLFIRAVFADDSTLPVSEDAAADVMSQASAFFVEVSYHKTALVSTIAPVVTLPQPKMFYAVKGPGALRADALAAAKTAGFDSANYDLDIVRHESVPGFTWGGLAAVGGRSCWLQSSGLGVVCHELGHNYGLGHANFWDTTRPALPANPNNLPFDPDSLIGHDNVIGPGNDIEYGDSFDTMGSGSGGGAALGATNPPLSVNGAHFNASAKRALAWLPEAYVAQVASSTTHRLFVHDVPTLSDGRAYALRVRKDSERDYWLSARSRFPGNPWLNGGVQVHWDAWMQAVGASDLLDTTPGSFPGRQDSALVLGRTFSDRPAEVHFTPVARGQTDGQTWYDVVVNLGPFPGNRLPTATLSASALRVAVGAPVTLSARGSDPDGDALAYYWDFEDATVGPNADTVSKAWDQPGDYTVRCEVSDGKGGVFTAHVAVTVGHPGTLRIAGRVLDDTSRPLAGVRVHNGRLDANQDPGPDYRWTYTDSDGRYTLSGLSNGTYSVGAFLHGYLTRPLNFPGSITVADVDASDAQFLAVPQPQVTVRTEAEADRRTGQAGAFSLARTGDTNTALRAYFLLAGSAQGGTDYVAYTNLVTQTNIVPTLLGDVTQLLKFYYVDFPTGVVTVSLPIAPMPGGATNPETEVVLTLMYPVEVERRTPETTNFIHYPGWQVVTNNTVAQWQQNYTDYVLASRAEARLRVLASPPPARPTVSIVAVDAVMSETPDDSVRLTLLRFGPGDAPLTVFLEAAGTATRDVDYTGLPDQVTIPAGASFVTLRLTAVRDQYLEGTEEVQVRIVPRADYVVAQGQALARILDDDLPRVTLAALERVADELTGRPAVVEFTRTGDLRDPLPVSYLVSGTALSGRDYRTLPGSLTIPAGRPSATLDVVPRDNRQADGGRTVVLMLSDNPTYNAGPPSTVTLAIHDAALPTLEVFASDPQAAEPGDPGEFTFLRQGDLSRELEVSYRVGGSAKPLSDYASIGQRVRLPAGVPLVTLPVTPIDDRFREDVENVVLELLPNAAYNLGRRHQAVVSLADDDAGAQPAVGFDLLSSSAPESQGRAELAVSITANPAENQDVVVYFKVTGGSATRGVDYTLEVPTNRLVFPHNPHASGKDAYTNRTLFVPLTLLDNAVMQPDRTVLVSLFDPGGYLTNEVVTNDVTFTNLLGEIETTNVVSTNIVVVGEPMNAWFDIYDTHTFTILDDDAGVFTVEATAPSASEAGPQPGAFTVRRSGATDRAQAVYFQIGGSASSGSDFVPIPGSLTFPPGIDALVVPVVVVDDPVQESTETVTLTLTSVPGGQIGAAGSAVVQIFDNDGTIEFTQPRYRAVEGVGLADIPVRRTSDTNLLATVEFAVSAGSATPGLDFVLTNGSLVFAPGETLKLLPVSLIDDLLVEPEETVVLALRNPTGGGPLGGQNTAVLTVLDDDTALEFEAAAFQVHENGTHARVTVVRAGIATRDVGVEYCTADGTATAPQDYVPVQGTLQFAPGQTRLTFTVPIVDDALAEGDEKIALVLTNATGGAAVGARGTADLVIVDDECALEWSASTVRVNEYERTVRLEIARRGGTVNPVAVDFVTSNGTARAGADYQAAQGTVQFRGDELQPVPDGSGTFAVVRGETNRTFDIRLFDDLEGEGDETFVVTLRAPVTSAAAQPGSATLGALTNATVVIRDNETPGSVEFEFNVGLGAEDRVRTLALQPDGKVLVGGDFTTMDGYVLNRVARLHEDGYLDSSFHPGAGAPASVYALALQADGRILVGGAFTNFNAAPWRHLVRLDADGALDAQWRPGAGPDGPVRAVAVFPDGRLAVAGDFTSVDGVPRRGVARLDRGGTLDPGFDVGAGPNGSVTGLAVDADGRLVVVGEFTRFGAAAAGRIVRLAATGAPDASFAPGAGADAAIRAVALEAEGRIVVAGAFARFDGVPRARVARLNADGSVDAGFDPLEGPDAEVRALGLSGGGKVVLGGAFTRVAGVDRGRFARLNGHGQLDLGFVVGTGANADVWALGVQPNTAIVIGGDFTEVDGLERPRVARIHGDERFVLGSVQFAQASVRVPEGAGTLEVTVQRGGRLEPPLAIEYRAVDGTAMGGLDFTPVSGVLAFAPGQTAATLRVPILDDALAEGNETFSLVLTNLPSGYDLNAQLSLVVVIEDDESAVAFGQAAYEVAESERVAAIAVVRSGNLGTRVTVDYVVEADTATAGVDFLPAQGTLEFAAGVTSQTLRVEVLDDDVPERDETVLVRLGNPQGGAALGSLERAVLTIRDDDRVPFYSLNLAPPLGGSVTPPSGAYPSDSLQTLVATPEPNFEFVAWEGTTNTGANPLTVRMDRHYVLTARFRVRVPVFTFAPPLAAEDLRLFPWQTSSGSSGWVVQAAAGPDRSSAVRSGFIGDLQSSVLTLFVDTRDGTGSFDVRVSSEPGWDVLEFHVNGQPVQRWSGDTGWRTVQFPVRRGWTRLEWRYSKDANFSAGLDAAFVDNLYVPLDRPNELPSKLAVPTLEAGRVRLLLSAQPGYVYVLEASTNLVTWGALATNTALGDTLGFDDPSAGEHPRRFYRALTR